MNILVSDKWLREYVAMKQGPEEFAAMISKIGPSVERINRPAADLGNVVVGKIVSLGKHPNADKLRVTVVDVGSKKLNIVCGGTNLYEGELVAVAMLGARVRWHGEGEPVTMERASIRGVESEGMICGANELGLADRYPHEEKEIMDLSKTGVKTGTPLAEALGLNDAVYDIEVTTNRPDALGVVGLAREAAAATGGKFLWTDPKLPTVGGGLKVKISANKLCPRYLGIAISGIKVGESPAWLKERLVSAGLRPINSVVDITNYVMLELGQPMHAFDAAKLDGGSIEVRTARAGEKLKALDGNTYELKPETLVIADAKRPVAVAGVIGGEESGVTAQTTAIVLEAASFNSTSVRKSGRELNVRTDALMRFEKNLPVGLVAPAAARAAALVLKICGGKTVSVRDVYPKKEAPPRLTVSADAISGRIGVTISPATIKKFLSSLGFAVTASGKKLSVRVPYFRVGDISIPEDLTEEVARLYGYERLPANLPPGAPSALPPDRVFEVEDRVRASLANAGATELISTSLIGDELLKKSSESEVPVARIANPLNIETSILRPSHRARLIECAARNEKMFESGEIFEIGNVFTPDTEAGVVPKEILEMGIAVWGRETDGRPFYRAKGLLERAARAAGAAVTFGKDFPKDGFWHAGRTVSVHVGSAVIGVLGELGEEARRTAGVESRLAVALVDFRELVVNGGRVPEFHEIPPFPPVLRDVAFIVPRETEHELIVASILAVDPLLVSAELFDRYEGKGVPEGKKSLAYHLAYQSKEKTLTAEAIEAVHAKVLAMLEHKFGAVPRA